MNLQAASHNRDPGQGPRPTTLAERLAKSRSLAEASARRGVPVGRAIWFSDPAFALGVPRGLLLALCAFTGFAAGVLTYDIFRTGLEPALAAPADVQPREAGVAEAGVTDAEGDLYVTVPALSEPAQAIDDYYYYLRLGMHERAWDLTTEEFRSDNYPGGLESYQETWSEQNGREVLSFTLIGQDASEARFAAEIQDGGADVRWRNTYVLRYNEATSSWKIDSITQVW